MSNQRDPRESVSSAALMLRLRWIGRSTCRVGAHWRRLSADGSEPHQAAVASDTPQLLQTAGG